MRSLSKHVDGIVTDNRVMNNEIIGSYSTCKIIETLNLFNINFNNNKNKLLSLAYGCRNDVAVLDKFGANGISIFSFNRHGFTNRVFTLMLIYRKQSL